MLSRSLEYNITARDRSAGAFRSFQDSARSAETRINGVVSAGQRLQRVFGALTFGVGAGSALREMNQLEQQLIRLRGVSSDFGGDQEFLVETSRQLGLNYKSFADTFTQLAALESIDLLDAGQARDLAVGFEQASARFGTSAADTALAVRGLRQALTQGIVRAQEFDQIFDAIGTAQPLVAKQLGLTTQEFQRLRTSNSLVAKELVDAFIPALNSLDGAAQTRAQSIQGSFNAIATSYQQALIAFNEPVSEGLQGLAIDGIVPVLDSIAANAETISTVVAGTAVALTLAYGGRRVSDLTNFAAAQARVISVSNAHNQALVTNTRLTLQNAQAEFRNNQAVVRSLASQAQQQRARIAANGSLRTNAALQNQLTNLVSQQSAATAALAASNQRVLASTRELSSVTRNASSATIALSTAGRGLSAAFSLVGGPIGAATIALGLFFQSVRESTQEIRGLRDLNNDLASSLDLGESDRLRITNEVADAEEKILQLRVRRASILDGEISGFDRLRTFVGTVNQEVLSLDFSIEQLRNQISIANSAELSILQGNALQEEEDFIQGLSASIRELSNTARSSQDILDQILPSRQKIEELTSLRSELEGVRESISVDEYNSANNAITEQINRLNGLTEARKRASQEQERAVTELTRIEESLLTERQRIQSDFDNVEDNILRLQVVLGDEGLSDERVASLVSVAREKLDLQLDELNQQLIRDEQKRIDDVTRARNEKLQERFDLELALRQTFNPVEGLTNIDDVNRRFEFEQDELTKQFDFKLNLDAEYVRRSAELEQQRVDQIASIQDQARQNRDTSIDLGVGFGSAVFEAFQQDVGNYIQITENMSQAERAYSEESNRINKQIFERNKRAQRSQAIIEGFGAVAKAFNSFPAPFSYVAAATAAISAAKIVSRINSTSFGGGGSVNFGGSGGSGGSSSDPSGQSSLDAANAANSNGGGNTVYFVTQIPPNLQGAIDQDWLYNNQQENLKRMTDDDIISVDAEQIRVADPRVPQSLRTN